MNRPFTPGWYWLTNCAGPANPYPVYVEQVLDGMATCRRLEPEGDNTRSYKGYKVPFESLTPIDQKNIRPQLPVIRVKQFEPVIKGEFYCGVYVAGAPVEAGRDILVTTDVEISSTPMIWQVYRIQKAERLPYDLTVIYNLELSRDPGVKDV